MKRKEKQREERDFEQNVKENYVDEKKEGERNIEGGLKPGLNFLFSECVGGCGESFFCCFLGGFVYRSVLRHDTAVSERHCSNSRCVAWKDMSPRS